MCVRAYGRGCECGWIFVGRYPLVDLRFNLHTFLTQFKPDFVEACCYKNAKGTVGRFEGYVIPSTLDELDYHHTGFRLIAAILGVMAHFGNIMCLVLFYIVLSFASSDSMDRSSYKAFVELNTQYTVLSSSLITFLGIACSLVTVNFSYDVYATLEVEFSGNSTLNTMAYPIFVHNAKQDGSFAGLFLILAQALYQITLIGYTWKTYRNASKDFELKKCKSQFF